MSQNVLVIDDESMMTRLLATMLLAYGYDARKAHSGAEALLYCASPPSLIISDTELGTQKGYDVYSDICQCVGYSIPVIPMSSHFRRKNVSLPLIQTDQESGIMDQKSCIITGDGVEHWRAASNGSLVDFLPKPITLRDLSSVLQVFEQKYTRN